MGWQRLQMRTQPAAARHLYCVRRTRNSPVQHRLDALSQVRRIGARVVNRADDTTAAEDNAAALLVQRRTRRQRRETPSTLPAPTIPMTEIAAEWQRDQQRRSGR